MIVLREYMHFYMLHSAMYVPFELSVQTSLLPGLMQAGNREMRLKE